jgi:2-dehydropantoate 2-reductase
MQGAILAFADKSKVPAPISERVLRLIKTAESAGTGSPRLRPDQVVGV